MFLLNLHSQTHRIGEKNREDALGRASALAQERKTIVTLAFEKVDGKTRKAVTMAAVNRDGKIQFFPGWEESEVSGVSHSG